MLKSIIKRIKLFNKLSDDKKFMLITPIIILFMLFLGIMSVLENKNTEANTTDSGAQNTNTIQDRLARFFQGLKTPMPNTAQRQVGAKLNVCTDKAEQPDCYSDDFPAPSLIWKCSPEESEVNSEEYMFNLQIDNDLDFSSPEIDSGDIITKNNFYIVDEHGLTAGETYYWRIKGRNSAGVWSGWAAEEDSFVVAPMCE